MELTNKAMQDCIIHPKKDLLLRKMGSRYMIVDACGDNANMTNVFSLNNSAASLWQRANEGEFTTEELAGWMAENYGIDIETATDDTLKQLEQWKEFGMVEYQCAQE